MGQGHVRHPEALILPAELRCFGIDEVQCIAEAGVAGEQPRQAESVVTADMGDENGSQLHHGLVSA